MRPKAPIPNINTRQIPSRANIFTYLSSLCKHFAYFVTIFHIKAVLLYILTVFLCHFYIFVAIEAPY